MEHRPENRLVIIGRPIYANQPFLDYIDRELRHFGTVEKSLTIPENDTEILTILQQEVAKPGNLIIVTTKAMFTPVGKLIATILDDTLILKENQLIPSKSEIYDDQSFLVRADGCTINVVEATPGHTLPMFLIEAEEKNGIFHLFDIDEESARILLEPLGRTYDIDTAITTLTPGWLQIECLNKKYGRMSRFLNSVRQLFEGRVIESTNVFAYLVHRLAEANKTVTFAESCTGGLIAAKLTAEAGASDIFRGSLVTYSNALKAGWLGVEKEILETHGAVSEACVEQMLKGAKEIAKADYALAVSGIAGPGGGTPSKPVGTVFIGAISDNDTIVERLFFEGDRNYIQQQSMLYAYKLLFRVAAAELFRQP